MSSKKKDKRELGDLGQELLDDLTKDLSLLDDDAQYEALGARNWLLNLLGWYLTANPDHTVPVQDVADVSIRVVGVSQELRKEINKAFKSIDGATVH